jgi:hypothetical protein
MNADGGGRNLIAAKRLKKHKKEDEEKSHARGQISYRRQRRWFLGFVLAEPMTCSVGAKSL